MTTDHKPPTDDEIREALAAEAKMTPGPWAWRDLDSHDQRTLYYAGIGIVDSGLSQGDGIGVFEHQSLSPDQPDREGIALLRNIAPRALRELVALRKILRELGKICEMGNAYEVLPDIVRHWKDAACRNIHLRAASEERVKKLEGTLRRIATSRHCQCGDAPSQYSRGMVDGCRLAAQAARDALADSPDAPAGEGD